MKCPNCGAPLTGNETFCPECAVRLPARAAADVVEAVRAPRRGRRWLRRNLLPVGLVAVAVVGIAAIVATLVLSSTPPDPLREARRLYALHRDAEAVAAAARAIEQGAGTTDAYLLLGKAHLRLGQYAEAADAFAYAQAYDADLAASYLGLGQAAFHLGQEEVAEANLVEAVDRLPDSSEAHAYLGALYYRQGRLEEAQAHLARALQLDPDNGWARAYLGRTYLQMGERAAAIRELERALQADPSNVEGRLALARAYAAEGQYDQAAVNFRSVLLEHPLDLEALLGYGEALLVLDRAGDAEDVLRKALTDAGLGDRAHRAALLGGWVNWHEGEYAQAHDWFTAALLFAPESAEAYNGLGWTAVGMGDCDAARLAFQKALSLRPEDWPGPQSPEAGLERCR